MVVGGQQRCGDGESKGRRDPGPDMDLFTSPSLPAKLGPYLCCCVLGLFCAGVRPRCLKIAPERPRCRKGVAQVSRRCRAGVAQVSRRSDFTKI